jgi:phenylalanyl-tRNA synthetase beta chain
MPLVPLAAPEVNWERQVERRVKDIIAENLAFSESYNYSFVNRDKIGDFGLKVVDHIVLKNYLSADQSLLRTSLIPNLLKNVVDNLRFYEDFKIFEIGRVFWKQAGAYSKHVGSDDKLPFQDKFLSAVVVEKDNQKPFYVVKGALESLFKNLNLDYQFQPLAKAMPAFALSSRVLEVAVKGKVLGTVGEVSDLTRSKLDISSAVGYFELDFTELAKTVTGDKKYQELLKYPVVYRDLALLLSQNVSWEEVKKAVKKIGGELVRNIELFDVYEGDKIEVGQRSLAFHLEYYSAERTLEAKEVDEIQQKIIAGLEKKFGAKTR